MSGDNESSPPLPLKARVADLLNEIDRLEHSLALPAFDKQDLALNSVTSLLEISRQELRGLSAEECQENAILLAQLAFHVQRKENRLKTVVQMCQANLPMLIAQTVGSQRGNSLEERRLLAIRNNPVAYKLKQVEIQHDLQLTSLGYLAMRIEFYSRLFAEQAKIKGKQHG